jgi:hypothetical protein
MSDIKGAKDNITVVQIYASKFITLRFQSFSVVPLLLYGMLPLIALRYLHYSISL